jgi:hypothetical protein
MRLRTRSDGEELKKLWGMKEDLQKMAAFIMTLV